MNSFWAYPDAYSPKTERDVFGLVLSCCTILNYCFLSEIWGIFFPSEGRVGGLTEVLTTRCNTAKSIFDETMADKKDKTDENDVWKWQKSSKRKKLCHPYTELRLSRAAKAEHGSEIVVAIRRLLLLQLVAVAILSVDPVLLATRV